MSDTPDPHSSGQASAPAYDNKRGCLTLLILTVVTLGVAIAAVLLFNDFGK